MTVVTSVCPCTKLCLFTGLVLVAVACSSNDSKSPDGGGSQDVLPDVAQPDVDRSDTIADTEPDSAKPLDAAEDAAPLICEPGSKTGSPSGADDQSTTSGRLFNVHTPSSYDPEQPHALIVVYAGANRTRIDLEEKTELGEPATQRGYIVAFVDHGTPGEDDKDLASVPDLVAEKWCVDPSRVYLTGHSDGGSATYLILLNRLFSEPPAAVAPSAAGLSGAGLNSTYCPSVPVPVMILHSEEDKLFPGFGAEMFEWLAGCYGCSSAVTTVGNCVVHDSCTTAGLRYCEHDGKHGSWPDELNEDLLNFFDEVGQAM